MTEEKPRLTRHEVRKRLREKAHELDRDMAKNAKAEDARIDEMIRKSIKDHGA
jgi:hypothetical protein